MLFLSVFLFLLQLYKIIHPCSNWTHPRKAIDVTESNQIKARLHSVLKTPN